MPWLCYIDEAGNTETLASATHHAQPVMVIAGLLVDQQCILPLTKEFIQIKRNFYPKRLGNLTHDLEGLRVEIKGNDLRTEIRKHIVAKQTKNLRYRFRYVHALLDLMQRHQARYVASVWIKQIGTPVKHNAIYTTSVQYICRDFHRLLESRNDSGFVIADFRDPMQNNVVSHAVGTQKLKAAGDALPRILEAPTFAISHNHAALQLTDLLCSTLLYPIAANSYCSGFVKNTHVRPEDSHFKAEFGSRLMRLQFRYWKFIGIRPRRSGGAFVIDALGHRGSQLLFK
jgi:uncharacterized protein DUF3800